MHGSSIPQYVPAKNPYISQTRIRGRYADSFAKERSLENLHQLRTDSSPSAFTAERPRPASTRPFEYSGLEAGSLKRENPLYSARGFTQMQMGATGQVGRSIGLEVPVPKRPGVSAHSATRISDQLHHLQVEKQDLEKSVHEIGLMKRDYELLRGESRHLQTLQGLLDSKDQRIVSLETEIQLLEDDLMRIREEGVRTPTSSSSGFEEAERVVGQLRATERVLRSKVEYLTQELAGRDTECASLQSQLEACERHRSDSEHKIAVLKEQLKARDHKLHILGSDLEDLRRRLKDKEQLLEKRSKAATSLQTERRSLELQLTEAQDSLDIKDRKLSVLQRKIDNLEAIVSEKEQQLPTDEKASSSAHDRQLDRLRQQNERLEQESERELANHKRATAELKVSVLSLQRELEEKVATVSELREQVGELRNEKFRLEGSVSSLQSELSAMQMELELTQGNTQQQQQQQHHRMNSSYNSLSSPAAGGSRQQQQQQQQQQQPSAIVEQLRQRLRESEQQRAQRETEAQQLEERVADLELQLATAPMQQQQLQLRNPTGSSSSSSSNMRELDAALKDLGQRVAQLRDPRQPDTERLQRTGRELQARIDDMQNLVSAFAAAPDVSDGVAEMRRVMEEKDRQLSHFKEQLAAARVQQEQLEFDKEQLQAKLTRLTASADSGLAKDLENQLSSARQRLNDKEDLIRKLEKEAQSGRESQTDLEMCRKANGDLQTSLSDKEEQIRILNRDLQRFKTEQTSLNRSVQDLQVEVKAKVERIAELEAAAKASREELTAARKQLGVAESDAKSARKQLSDREEQVKHLQSCATEEQSRLRNSHKDAQQEAATLRMKLEAREMELKKVVSEQEKCKSEAENNKKQLLEAEKFAARLQAELEEKANKMNRIELEVLRPQSQEIERQQKNLDDLQHRMSQTHARLEEREHRIRRLEQENKDMLDEIHSLRKKTYELEGQFDTLRIQISGGDPSATAPQTQMHRLQTEICELRNRCKTVSEERDRMQREIKILESQVSSLQQNSFLLANCKQEVSRLQRELTGRQTLVEKLQADLQRIGQAANQSGHDLRRQLAEAEKRLKQREDECKAKEKHLLEWNSFWERHQRECQAKEAQVKQLTQQLERVASQQNASNQQDSRMQMEIRQRFDSEMSAVRNRLQAEVAKRDKALQEISADVAKRDNALQEVTAELAKRDNALREISRDLADNKAAVIGGNVDKQRVIVELQQSLQQKDSRLKDVSLELHQCQMELQSLNDELRDKERRLHAQQQQLELRGRGDNRGADRRLGDRNRQLEEELTKVRKTVQEKEHRIHVLETECFQNQVEEIERLRREVNSLAGGGGVNVNVNKPDVNAVNELQAMRGEIVRLKREIQVREDTIGRLEQQPQQQQQQQPMLELQRLRNEHSHCTATISELRSCLQQREQELRNLQQQMERQLQELLESKEEALMSSICEKDANIALLEISSQGRAAGSAHVQNQLRKLADDKARVQAQLQHLANSKMKLKEQQQRRSMNQPATNQIAATAAAAAAAAAPLQQR